MIAAAAPFHERVAGDHFVPSRGGTGGRRPSAPSAGSRRRSATTRRPSALLHHRNKSGRDLGAGLVDVQLADPRRLPDWGYALVDFLLARPPTAAADPATGRPGAPFVAFRRAMNRLGGRQGRVGPPACP